MESLTNPILSGTIIRINDGTQENNDSRLERSSLDIIKKKAQQDEEECRRRDEIFITRVLVCSNQKLSLKNIFYAIYFFLQLLSITIPFVNPSSNSTYTEQRCNNFNSDVYPPTFQNTLCNQNININVIPDLLPGQSYTFQSTFCHGTINASYTDTYYSSQIEIQLIQNSPKVTLANNTLQNPLYLNYLYTGTGCEAMHLNITNTEGFLGGYVSPGCLFLNANLLVENTGYIREACSKSAYSAIFSLLNTLVTFFTAWIKIYLAQELTLEATKEEKRFFLIWSDPVDNLYKRIYYIPRSEDELKAKKRFNAYLDNNSRAVVPRDYKKCRYDEIIAVDDAEERKKAMLLGLQRKADCLTFIRAILKIIVSSHYTYYVLWLINVVCAILYYTLACGSKVAAWYLFNMILNLSVDFSLAIYYVVYYRGTIEFEKNTETKVLSALAFVPAAFVEKEEDYKNKK